MGIFIEIIKFGASSIFWGLLMSAAMMGLFIFIVRGWWKDALFTVWTYVAAGILAILLAFQCTLMVGALKIRSSCDEYEVLLSGIVNKYYKNPHEIVSPESSANMFQELADQYPLLRNYVGAIAGSEDGINGSGYIYGENYQAADMAPGLMDYLKGLITSYIWRRVFWCLGFAIVLGAISIYTLEKNTQSRLKTRSDNRLDRGGRDTQRIGNRGSQRISRDTRRISRRH